MDGRRWGEVEIGEAIIRWRMENFQQIRSCALLSLLGREVNIVGVECQWQCRKYTYSTPHTGTEMAFYVLMCR